MCKTAKIAIITEVLFTFVPSARHLFEMIFPLGSFRIIYLRIYAGVLRFRENKYSWSISFAHKQKIMYISRTKVFPLTSSYLHKTLISITLACHHQWSSKKWFDKYYLTARNIGKSMEKTSDDRTWYTYCERILTAERDTYNCVTGYNGYLNLFLITYNSY